jgi:RNA polymerase sigma factor (sigma-70 family)
MQLPDLSKLKQGDQAAWASTFDWLWPSAKTKALMTGMNRCCADDAEDVASASISVLARKVKDGLVQKAEELKALLSRIVHDQAIDHCRGLLAKKRGGGMTTSLEGMQEGDKGAYEPASDDSPLDKLEIADLGQLIQKAGQQLKTKEWGLLEDFFFGELSYKEISDKHGIAVGSVGVYIKRATEKLRPLMKEYQITM